MRSRGKWMALKTVPEMRNVKCVELFGLIAQDDLRLSPSKYDETQVSARKTGVTRLNVQGTGANLGHRAKIYQLIAKHQRMAWQQRWPASCPS